MDEFTEKVTGEIRDRVKELEGRRKDVASQLEAIDSELPRLKQALEELGRRPGPKPKNED